MYQTAGDEPHDKPEDQSAELPPDVIADIRETAHGAIFQFQPIGTPEGIYTEVKQGLSEPFTSFIDYFMQVVDQQLSE